MYQIAHHQAQNQSEHQHHETVVVQHARPSIADMLSSTQVNDSDVTSPKCRQPPSPPVTRTQCSDGPNTDTDSGNKPEYRPITTSGQLETISDRSEVSDVSHCSISVDGDRSLHSLVSSTHRLQKQPLIPSLHSRTVSQIFPPSSEFGSMTSGLNYSLPQLSNIDSIDLYASQNRLNRTADGFCEKSVNVNYCSPSDSGNKTPQAPHLGHGVMKNGVEEFIARQQVSVEGTLKTQDDLLSRCASSTHPSRREEEERRLAEFSAIEDSLKTALSTIDQQLEKIETTCTNLSSSSDLETVDNLSSQFAQSEHQLIQLTAASGDIIEITDSVSVVKAIQNKVTEITGQVTATRKRLVDTRAKVQANYDKHHCNKVEMNQLIDWLSDANRRLAECTHRPSVDVIAAEQLLGQLLTLLHEFTARKNRLQNLENCTGLDHNSVVELKHQFERTNDACRAGLERHRVLFAGLTDIRNGIQEIASWVAKIGSIYSLDSGSAAGSLEMLEDNHAELENRLEEAAQLKERANEFLASLRTTKGQEGQGQEVEEQGKGYWEDESCLLQPLLDVQCQICQLRELIATRAANMVKPLCLLYLSVCLSVSCSL